MITHQPTAWWISDIATSGGVLQPLENSGWDLHPITVIEDLECALVNRRSEPDSSPDAVFFGRGLDRLGWREVLLSLSSEGMKTYCIPFSSDETVNKMIIQTLQLNREPMGDLTFVSWGINPQASDLSTDIGILDRSVRSFRGGEGGLNFLARR